MTKEFEDCLKRRKIRSMLDERLSTTEAKKLRENADYYGEFSQDAARQLIEDAKQFLRIARKMPG
ncbi:MAG: hypothetical protein ACYC6Z_04095 [Thermoleophilia bacterium]